MAIEIPPDPATSVAGTPDGGQADLARWHERSRWVPLATFGVAFGVWITALAAGLMVESILIRAALAVPLAVAAGQLFMIGHDAAHDSHSPSRLVNGIIGRLAFLPSLHVFGLWRAHHGTHHRYTNLAGRDFVWTPLSPEQYAALSPWKQRLHRLYRHESGLGLGLHYLLEIWVPRMLWPRRRHDMPKRRALIADSLLLALIVIGGTALAVVFVLGARPEGATDVGSWASAAVFLVVVPLIATHWMIGWVIYLNHTHPDIVWYDDPVDWSRHRVQLEGSVGLNFGGVADLVWPRRIMHHTAHHVDPGVPLRHLADAQRHLETTLGSQVVSYRWSLPMFRKILARCKLYDYGTKTWLDYEATSGDGL